MPSTLVHVALAGLIGTALLADRFDARSILVVLGATALVDLDTFLDLVVIGAHRSVLHNLVWPALAALALWWDLRREESYVRGRWGGRGVRVAWVSLFAVVTAGVLLDAFFNGVNLFWPLHDRFYDLSGKLLYSDQRGIVQTFVEFAQSSDGTRALSEATADGSVGETHYRTGVKPTADGSDAERLFPIAMTGERFVLLLSGYGVVGWRLFEERSD
ncbi:LexA-binding, inner membrane-associated putative hydrolase [Natronoarchaeum philippinense]|uniref:LexA-binding, inner membrane-associated putative hydrolase n=1 Tax=Natronoarchaeum philippinense TaxID=558529 RepID=A0A285N898_NATPI|nr:metal-dependent hydrolase [Natronoarchaeum philippinense]SNZ05695.1 LexA-binding, inner membrane-associated putative hydrolase [Natronoarchaeum philippinense]